MNRVAGLVLAAGAGRRFGGPKGVVEFAGERLVDRAVRVLRDGGVHGVYVVAGAVALDPPGATAIENPDWETGMASSLRTGLAGLPPDTSAAMVVLVDQPGLTAEIVSRLLDATEDEASVVQATYDGRRGHPVVLGREHWTTVAELASGDVGARPFLDRMADGVTTVECADAGDDVDVDHVSDLTRWPTD